MLFVLLILIFGGLIWWLVRTRLVALRVIAACLSFVVAMQFGVLAVNKYFGYYSTWGAAIADFSNQSTYSGPLATEGSLLAGNRSMAFDQHTVYLRLALQQGYTLRLTLRGKLSHLTRSVYVYLPPPTSSSSTRTIGFRLSSSFTVSQASRKIGSTWSACR